ncbi:MAG: hypothetical protein WCL49_10050 [bacterium]
MQLYQLNMAREQVFSLEKRRRWFRWVFAYLAVAIVVIAGAAYYLTVSAVDLSARRRAMDEQERLFLKQHPGTQSVSEYQKKVTSELVGLSSSLEAVTQFKASGQKSAAIVLGLAEALPQGVDLGRLVLDGDGGTVKMDVYVPVALKRDVGLTQPNVISRWEGSALLKSQIQQITSENSARVNLEGREFLNWRFTGVLEKDLK